MTLESQGIDKNLAKRARTYAQMPKEDFEVAAARRKEVPSAKPSVSTERQRELEARNDAIVAPAATGWAADDIAREFGMVTRQVHRVLERARGWAAAPLPELSMIAQEKLEAAIRIAKRHPSGWAMR